MVCDQLIRPCSLDGPQQIALQRVHASVAVCGVMLPCAPALVSVLFLYLLPVGCVSVILRSLTETLLDARVNLVLVVV